MQEPKKTLDIKPEYKPRAVAEPPTSSVVKGPREGFVEDIAINLGLIERRIAHHDLEFTQMQLGRLTKTTIVVAFIKSVADGKLAQRIVKRLQELDCDGVLDSHNLVEHLQTESAIFRQVGSAEKPDIIAAKLLEGRVAIFVDGSPMVLTLPYIILEDLQNSDDYYSNHVAASFKRCVRLFGVFISILLPAFYVAVQLYHYKIVPISALITITNSVLNSPFSPMIEVLFVLVLFEILYEASLRMPRHLGMATSIVGALVLGDTAVKAGLLSSTSVLVAALSGITLYIIPDSAPQISLLRFFFCILAAVFGLFGVVIGGIILITYLNGLENYGAPYLSPFAPYIKSDSKDALLKTSFTNQIMRPKVFNNKNKRRQAGFK